MSSAPDCTQHALSAAYYADAAEMRTVEIAANEQIATATYRLRLASPELAATMTPGQFLMLRLPSRDNPLLGRPFALFDTYLDERGDAVGIDIGYVAIGRMTHLLAELTPGDKLEVWGPLGNGFQPPAIDEPPTDHLLMVAGGIGQTPFLALGREALAGRQYGAMRHGTPRREIAPIKKVTLCYGVRSAEYAAGVEYFRSAGIDVQLSSDDGSLGHHGLVTDLLNQTLDEHEANDSSGTCRIVCCGPEPMMEAVAKIAAKREVACQVSLETPMACGIGICFSCVAKVMQDDGAWDYKRTCVEGPIFDAKKIVW